MGVGEAFREHHRMLLEHLAAYVEGPAFSWEELRSLRDFLRQELLPHARGEERALYPRWSRCSTGTVRRRRPCGWTTSSSKATSARSRTSSGR
jgi:Hemerythrin HHE cation binding domain.